MSGLIQHKLTLPMEEVVPTFCSLWVSSPVPFCAYPGQGMNLAENKSHN